MDGELVSHQHYGGRACYSCRGFFRRAVQTEHYKVFLCEGAGDCVIRSKSRKSCKLCRFQRCRDLAGMRVGLVMTPDEKRERKLGSTRRQMEMAVKATLADARQQAMLYPKFTSEERAQFVRLFLDLHSHNHAKCYDFFAQQESHLNVCKSITVVMMSSYCIILIFIVVFRRILH